jgi:citrate lyase subunit beta/citryl-CoA lyase
VNPIGPAWLFCPADRPDRYLKALERADRVILDLEDAVAADRKDFARTALLEYPVDPDRVIVRVNSTRSSGGQADLEALQQTRYRTIMVPKAESAAELDVLDGFDVVALCETSAGVLAAPEIARHPSVVALMWGAEDLVADMGGRGSRGPDGGYYGVALHTRSRILLAASAAGVVAVDAVYLNIADLGGLRAEAREAVDSGFAVKACIHPGQVPVVRETFLPTPEQVSWARAIIAADTGGVVSLDGVMVDGPVVLQARHVLARHENTTSDS